MSAVASMVAIERAAEVATGARKPAWKERPVVIRVSIVVNRRRDDRSLSAKSAFASRQRFVPRQKQDAQRRKREWAHRPLYAVAIVLLLGVALTYSLSVNFLSMFESTMCLKFAGGAGC